MRAPDLEQALRASVQSPPYDTLDLDALVASGRQRVRRRAVRRAAAGLGVSALVASLVAATMLFPGISGLRVVPPAGGDVPAGEVLHLDDATDAVRGTDYRVLTTYASGDLDEANGRSFGPMLSDGTVVVQDGPSGTDNRSRWGLLDPDTATTTWLADPVGPEVPSAPQRAVAANERYLVLDAASTEDGSLTLWVLDRRADRWHRKALPVPGAVADLMTPAYALDGDRLYVGLQSDLVADRNRQHLHSVALGGLVDESGRTGLLRDERLDLGDFDITDGRLVYLPRRNAPTSELHVRTLESGSEKVHDIRSGDRCNQLGLQAAGRYVALGQYCGTRATVRDDRVQVVDLDGDPVVTVQDSNIDGAAAMSDRFVTLVSGMPGQDGTYAYDLQRRRLVRLSTQGSSWYGGNAAEGDRLAWSDGILDGRGRRTVFADLP